jgi:adenylate cyclase class 2
MREIEIKAKVTSKDGLLATLQAKGIELGEPKKQHDVVYAEPNAVEDPSAHNWLRIRTEDDKMVIFTLKRSINGQLDNIEHEVRVDNSDEMDSIIKHLGYEHFSDLTKIRRKTMVGDIEICLDEVPELGIYIEAEKLCAEEVDGDKVVNELWQLLESLGVHRSDEETHGYDVLMRTHPNNAD